MIISPNHFFCKIHNSCKLVNSSHNFYHCFIRMNSFVCLIIETSPNANLKVLLVLSFFVLSWYFKSMARLLSEWVGQEILSWPLASEIVYLDTQLDVVRWGVTYNTMHFVAKIPIDALEGFHHSGDFEATYLRVILTVLLPVFLQTIFSLHIFCVPFFWIISRQCEIKFEIR